MKIFIFSSAETEPDFVSKCIMRFMKTDYSHVGVLIEFSDRSEIVHSTGKGVNREDTKHFLKDHVFKHKIDITDQIIDERYALGWLAGNIGKDYSESQYIGFVFPSLQEYFSDGHAESICSEFAARFLTECTTIQKFLTRNIDFVTPKDVIEAVVA